MTQMSLLKTAAAAVLGIVLTGAILAGEKAADADVWILSGQSNACGRGLPPGPPANAAVEVFDPKSGKWGTARDPLPGMETQGVGPWQAAATEYAAKTGRKVRLAGWAVGGVPIDYWNVPKKPDDPYNGWVSLSNVVDRAGKDGGVFLWYQGEGDCGKDPGKYLGQLKDLTSRVRERCGNPKMTAVVVQLESVLWGRQPAAKGDMCGAMTMREAQRQFVLQDGNALLVTAMGRKLKPKDDCHLSTEGQVELGGEIGRALARHLHKVDTGWPGPVLDVAVLGDDGKTVVAHFAEVKKLAGFAAADFGIVAVGGKSAEILAVAAKAEALGNTMVKVTFDTPVNLPAALVYGLGNAPTAGLVDEADNRAPAVQLEITQGKAPEDKETVVPNGAGAMPR